MKGSRLLFVASWIILLLLSITIAYAALASTHLAYLGNSDSLSQSLTLDQIREVGGEDAAKAFKGRRVTAATWALGYAILCGWVVMVPYRRGARWAWWALLLSLGLAQLLSIARLVILGTSVGAGASGIILAFLLIGLLAGAPRIFAGREPEEAAYKTEAS